MNRHAHPAGSGCRRLTLSARHTRSHFPRTLSRPRTLKRRNPRTSLVQPLGVASTPLWRRQFLGQAMHRRVCARVAAHRPPTLAPGRHVPVDASCFELRQVLLIAVSGVRKHRFGALAEPVLDHVEQFPHRAPVARVCRHLRRDNQLMPATDRQLRVVALLEAFGASLHDGAVRVGEVALRLLIRLSAGALTGPATLRIAHNPRLAATGRIRLPVQLRDWCGDTGQLRELAVAVLAQTIRLRDGLREDGPCGVAPGIDKGVERVLREWRR